MNFFKKMSTKVIAFLTIVYLLYTFTGCSSKFPTLKKEDIPNFNKVAIFVKWFMKNDELVTISNPSTNILFDEGYRPKSGMPNDPESINPNISNVEEWFITKIFLDLNMLKDVTKEEFMQFIDILNEASTETLITVGRIALKYNLDFENFVYEREIEKIPAGIERERFKENFFTDSILASETRILGWLYHEYFGEWYLFKELRNE